MLRDFADWLRLARPELTSEVVTLRWSAAETFKQSVDPQTALDVVRLSYKMSPRDGGVRQRLEAGLQQADAAFPMRGNVYEVQVVAASVAMLLLEDESDVADVTALAIASANAADFRNPAVLPELVPRAEKYLVQRGTAVRREVPVVRPQLTTAVSKAVNEYVKADPAARDAATAFKAMSAAIQILADSLGVIADANTRSAATLFERSEMMWYAMGNHDLASGQILKSFRDATPLVVAVDMADITRFRVPPVAARAIMLRVLVEALGRKGVKAVSIPDAVAALNAESRARFTDAMPLHVTADLCPLHEAIASNKGASDFVDELGLDSKAVWAAEQLAYQAYIERLLIAAVAQVK
jgi:hypothetical protein